MSPTLTTLIREFSQHSALTAILH